jgi:MFS family permease
MKRRPGTSLPRIAQIVSPLDRSLARMLSSLPGAVEVRRLRWFWLDSLFSTVSVSFYTSFIPLFALAYGANNAQIGQVTAIASLCGLVALFPGAEAIKLMKGRRKALVVLFGGGVARVAILAWLVLPLMTANRAAAVTIIIAVNAVITFAAYFANPAWTAIVADIVPRDIRGRFFSHRNFAVNIPALLVVPVAGLLIQAGNTPGHPFAGYQLAFALALATGAISTYAFSRIDDPLPLDQASRPVPVATWIRSIWTAPSFVSLVVCTLIWNLGVQMVSPFLNVYLVNRLNASTAMVGYVAGAASLTAILTQQWVGRWVDRKGNIWIQGVLGFVITWIPIAWMLAGAAWQLVIINGIAGILWTGYNLASFNLLLDLAPAEGRAEASALFQLVIVGSAAVAPIVGGRLADSFGYQPMFFVSTVLRLIGAVAFVWWVARPDARRAGRLARAKQLSGRAD